MGQTGATGQTDGTWLALPELVRLRAAARGLRLDAKSRALSVQAGGYLSPYRGRGLEFDEVRPYQPGDDARNIDWRVTARRGEPYTKLFREERERPVLLLADLGAGMYFGSRRQFKFVLAGRMAALLAWAAERSGDRVGGVVQGPESHAEIPPAPRQSGVLPLLGALVKHQPRAPGPLRPGRLDGALKRLLRVARPGSLVVILSDFQEAGDEAPRRLRALAQHNDLIGALLYDPLEAEPPVSGRFHFGLPGGRRFAFEGGGEEGARLWRRAFAERRDRAAALVRRCGGRFMLAPGSESALDNLRRGLAGQSLRRIGRKAP